MADPTTPEHPEHSVSLEQPSDTDDRFVLILGGGETIELYGPFNDREDLDDDARELRTRAWRIASLTALPAQWTRESAQLPVILKRETIAAGLKSARRALDGDSWDDERAALFDLYETLDELVAVAAGDDDVPDEPVAKPLRMLIVGDLDVGFNFYGPLGAHDVNQEAHGLNSHYSWIADLQELPPGSHINAAPGSLGMVLVIGDPVRGLTCHGPISTADEVNAHAPTLRGRTWWVVDIEPLPEEWRAVTTA